MTEEDDKLAEIKARLDAIVPGPWRWYGNTATDQVYLATVDRGRLIIAVPDTRTTEYVYDALEGAGYELEDARQQVHELWCPQHSIRADPADPGRCMCDELRDFLRGSLEPEEGHRYFNESDRGYKVDLMRAVRVHTDLRFAVREPGDRHGVGRMRSYREMVRYEVLGRKLDDYFREYRTVAEYTAEERKPVKDALYREDFCGLDNAEATFIERAPEDVAWLVAALETERAVNDELTERLAKLRRETMRDVM